MPERGRGVATINKIYYRGITSHLLEQAGNEATLAQLAQQAGASARTISTFQEETGLSS